MYKYLSTIKNWQKYVAIERGILFYEMQSDNIVEIIFSFLKEARAFVSPFYVLYNSILDIIKLMLSMHEKYIITDANSEARVLGITERYVII